MQQTTRRLDQGPGSPVMVRLGLVAGVVVPAVFAFGVLIAGAAFPGYSHVTQKISELGGVEATSAWIQNLNFVVLGILVAAFAWALGRALGQPQTGAVLIGVFAVSSGIGSVVFPCDAGCDGATTVGLLHNVAGVTGFVSVIIAMLLLGRRWAVDANWRGHASFTRGARWAAVVCLVWFIATQAADAQATAGVAQRLMVTAMLGWISVTAWRVSRSLEA